MAWFHAVAHDAGGVAWSNRRWMSWNIFLAVVPAVWALLVFRHRRRGGALWWLALVPLLLVLPNAPYLVTDLVHLRGDVVRTHSDAAVYFGLLPLYAVFIAIGFGCYAVCLREMGSWMHRTGQRRWVWTTEMALHGLCAVGVLLGRVAHLNSWDTVTRPVHAAGQTVHTLASPGAPVALVVLFAVIWAGHGVTRALAAAMATSLARGRGALDLHWRRA